MATNTVLAKMAVNIAANTAQFNAAMAQSSARLNAFEKTAINVSRTLIGGFGVYQVFNAFKSGVSIIADFERQMNKVRAVSGSTGVEFSRLEKNALALGKSTEYTARQIAGLQLEYSRLGFSTKEILNSTQATLDLATATGEDLARSAEIAGSTLRGFGLDATEMGRVTDVITGALNNSALTLSYFADAVKYVSPVARATNVTLEETAAILSVLADAGIKGTQAGTSVRRIMTELNKSGKPLVERLQELAGAGISLADANDEVGLFAQTALLVLGKQIGTVKELSEEYRDLNGEAGRTADLIRDDLTGDFDKLTSAMEGAVLQGGAFNSLLRSIIQSGTSLIDVVSDDAKVVGDLYNIATKGSLKNPIDELRRQVAFYNRDFAGKATEDINLAKYFDRIEKINEAAAKAGLSTTEGPDGKFYIDYVTAAEKAAEAAAKQKAEAQRIVEEAQEEARLRREAAEAAEKQLIARRKQLKLERDIRNAEFEGLKEDGLPDPLDFSKAFKPDLFNNPKLRGLLDEDTLGTAQDIADGYDLVFNQIVEGTERMTKANDDNKKAIDAQNDAYIRLAQTASNAIAQGIAGEKSFAQVLAATTGSIIDNLEAQALAAIVANSAKNSKNPILAIVAATAGFGIIKGLFGKIAKGRSNSGSGGQVGQINEAGSRISYANSPIQITGQLEVSGTSLKAVLKNQDRKDGVVRG